MENRDTTDLFQVNGNKLLVPDEDPEQSFEDIDSADTGRAEDGVMQRTVVRRKVGKWSFKYATISEHDKNYMENLFDSAGDTFTFKHQSRTSTSLVESTCYRSKYSLTWHNAVTGVYKNYTFNIIEC